MREASTRRTVTGTGTTLFSFQTNNCQGECQAANSEIMPDTKTVSTTKSQNKSTYYPFNRIEIPLSKEKTILLYRILIYVEKNDTKVGRKGFNIKALKPFLLHKRIQLDTHTPIESANINSNQIAYTDVRGSEVFSLLRHVRNAVAHAYIEKNNNMLILQDWRSGRCTMYGRIEEKLFFSLLQEIMKQKT